MPGIIALALAARFAVADARGARLEESAYLMKKTKQRMGGATQADQR